MNQIVRPQIPYRGSISGGLHEGKLIEIKGHVPYGADRFTVNFLTGYDPNSDRPLHISVRFPERVVVRNALQHNSWGPEERHGLFPFAIGRGFTLLILVDSAAYRMSVDNRHCWEFPHRIPFSRVSSIYIDGIVQIERIEYVNKYNPYPQPAINPAYPVYPGSVGGQFVYGIQPGVTVHTGQPARPAQRMGNLAPVFNPTIPYAYPIYGGLKPGMLIYINGRPSANAHKLTINLQSGTSPYPPPDIAFHFDVRFFNNTVVRNTRTNNAWGLEEVTNYLPLQPSMNFDIIIKVERNRYMLAVNSQHYCAYNHRLMPLSRFDTLYIENDIIISSIRFG